MKDNTLFETKTFLRSGDEVGMYYCGKRIKTINHKYGPEIRNHFLFVLVNEGEANFYQNGRIVHLKAHDLLVMCPGERIYYEAKSPWSIQWLGLYGNAVNKYMDVLSINGKNPIIHLKHFREAETIMDKIYSTAEDCSECSEAMQIGLIYQFFSILLQNQKNINSQDIVESAMRIIDYNLNTEITVEEISNTLHIDPSHLTRVFKSSVGISPKQYMLNKKIDLAKTLLTETSASIFDVAQSVGYPDQLYFSRIFKKKEGLSPYKYRKQNTVQINNNRSN
ncbi:MAG: AraC family transcriptional regulator [Clostridia bacterium]|nr:AraC family transcriptional regulator [Clostridia bacterium]